MVDGVEETIAGHGGLTTAPVSSPRFTRSAVAEVSAVSMPADVEWRSAAGSVFSAQTRSGGDRVVFAPYATFSSASLATRTGDNPADSTASSLRIGAQLHGPIRRDTAYFALAFDYQNIELPGRAPWERDTSEYDGDTVPLAATILAIASDSFDTDLPGRLSPSVTTWKGGSGSGRFDWRVSDQHAVTARFSGASWKERALTFDGDHGMGAGVTLAGRDLGAMISLASSAERWGNELRIGFSQARRDWQGPALPATLVVADAVQFGGRVAFPALFDQRQLDLVDAAQIVLSSHRIKVGGGIRLLSYQQQYAYGGAAIVNYGSLDDFAAGRGSAFQVVGGAAPVKFTIPEPSFFLQDTWSVSPEIDLLLGFRYDTQLLPKGSIAASADWASSSGITSGFVPRDRRGFAPRGAFVWNVRNEGRLIVRGGLGLHYDRLDPAVFAEAALFDGPTRVQRAVGDLGDWPDPFGGGSVTTATRLTLFADTYRAPRAFKADGSLSISLGGGGSLQLAGSFTHTDYLLRRVELNRILSGGSTTDGRQLWGNLTKLGSLVAAEPKSNRRFGTFDHVFGLAPTGFADHYEVSVHLERRLATGLMVLGSYTWARTRDNTVGTLSADPADQLSPFPLGIDGRDWTEGRSDLDIPHRVAATVEYRTSGVRPITIGARGRWRAGLPFTAGMPLGVDLNGDGATGNDPAFLASGNAELEQTLATLGCGGATGEFAVRNSCREKGVGSLDVRLAVGLLPLARGGSVHLTVDAFNVVTTKAGIVDRAALLIDPAGSITTDAGGKFVIPTLVNPRFGSFLIRRDPPRMIRAGLRLEY
jgi:hypothetical protein